MRISIEFGTRLHTHRNLENAILEQAKVLSDLRLQMASIYSKFAVAAREKKKVRQWDADIEAISKQIDGQVVAVFDKEGHLETQNDDD